VIHESQWLKDGYFGMPFADELLEKLSFEFKKPFGGGLLDDTKISQDDA